MNLWYKKSMYLTKRPSILAVAGMALGLIAAGLGSAPATAAPSVSAGTTAGITMPARAALASSPVPAALPSAVKSKRKTVTTANLNIRRGAGTKHRSLGVLKAGTTVVPTGKRSGKWWQVKASGKTGWVHSGYLKTVSVKSVRFANPCTALNQKKTRYNPGKAQRVSFAIAESYGSYRATFTQCVKSGSTWKKEWQTPATVGLRGFKKPGVASGHTGNRWSPQGMFSVTEAFGSGNPGTKLSYRKLNPRSRWSGTAGSSYNKYYLDKSASHRRWPDENLYKIMKAGDYRQAVVINYNRPPDSRIKQGAGFAIFLHTHVVPTWGCIAIGYGPLVKYVKNARKGDQIIMGVRSDIFQ